MSSKVEKLTRRRVALGGLEPELGSASLRRSFLSGEVKAPSGVELVVNVNFLSHKHLLNLHFHSLSLFLSLPLSLSTMHNNQGQRPWIQSPKSSNSGLRAQNPTC